MTGRQSRRVRMYDIIISEFSCLSFLQPLDVQAYQRYYTARGSREAVRVDRVLRAHARLTIGGRRLLACY